MSEPLKPVLCPNCNCEVPVGLFQGAIGAIRTNRKATASRENGKRGGYPGNFKTGSIKRTEKSGQITDSTPLPANSADFPAFPTASSPPGGPQPSPNGPQQEINRSAHESSAPERTGE